MCANTHRGSLSAIDVSGFTDDFAQKVEIEGKAFTGDLEHELNDASDPGRALPSFLALSILLLLRYQTSHVSWIVRHGM
jgi:hypothetical protein